MKNLLTDCGNCTLSHPSVYRSGM